MTADAVSVSPAASVVHGVECYDAWRAGADCPHERADKVLTVQTKCRHTVDMETTNTPAATTHLQGIGLCQAKPAADLAVGDVTIWNYGYTETVKAVTPCGKQSLNLTITSDRTGEEFTRKIRRTTLVAFR